MSDERSLNRIHKLVAEMCRVMERHVLIVAHGLDFGAWTDRRQWGEKV